MIYREPGFLCGRVIWLFVHPLPSHVSNLSLFLSHTTARKFGHLKNIQYSLGGGGAGDAGGVGGWSFVLQEPKMYKMILRKVPMICKNVVIFVRRLISYIFAIFRVSYFGVFSNTVHGLQKEITNR
jgi:hypothetical protein